MGLGQTKCECREARGRGETESRLREKEAVGEGVRESCIGENVYKCTQTHTAHTTHEITA